MLAVRIGGILIVSTLIGVLTAGVEGKLEALRKGRLQVLESGHTLILGRSAQIFTILSEQMKANESQKKARIVVLADKDKVEMEEDIPVAPTRWTCSNRNACRMAASPPRRPTPASRAPP